MIHERSYAKINLGLQVLNKRDDGYHNVKSIITSIALHDNLFIGSSDIISVECDKFVCRQEENLVYKVALILKEKYNVKQGTKIHIGKNIKVGGGLGGGSSNAAAAIRGLNKYWELGMSYEEMYDIALSLGSDVPYCLNGDLAVVEGRGEIITPLPFELNFGLVMVYPPYRCSTGSVYKAFKGSPKNDRYDNLYWEVITNDVNRYSKVLFNDLEEVVDSLNKKNAHYSIAAIKKHLVTAGCLGSLMSGSGSAVYGLTDSFNTALVVKERMKKIYPNFYIVATQSIRKTIT